MLTATSIFVMSTLSGAFAACMAGQQTATYVYDAQGRLTANATAAVSGNSNLALYGFDNASNRTSIQSGAVVPRASANQMASGELLLPGQALVSADTQSRLELRSTGALVITCNGADQLTLYPENGQAAQLIMQSDGNLVLYTPSFSALWATSGGGFPGAYLVLQNDGNLVIYQGSTPIWSSSTFC